MVGIYRFQSKTTKLSYIGQSIHIDQRYKEHLYNMNTLKDTENKWYQALQSQGIDNFIFSILEECHPAELNMKEIYWINYYDSFHNGYNSTPGGQSKYYDPQPIYDAWDEGLSPIEISNKLHIGTSCIYYNLINYENYNKHEAKCRGGKVAYKTKRKDQPNYFIYQYDLQGNFIKKWNSYKEIERTLGFDSALIGKCVSKKRTSAYEYQWTNYYQEKINKYNTKSSGKPKSIIQYDLQGCKIAEYESIAQAARAVHGDASLLRRVCKDFSKTAYGYKWQLK